MTMITTYFSNMKEEHLWILQVLLNQIDNMNLKICIKISSKQIQYVNHQSLQWHLMDPKFDPRHLLLLPNALEICSGPEQKRCRRLPLFDHQWLSAKPYCEVPELAVSDAEEPQKIETQNLNE